MGRDKILYTKDILKLEVAENLGYDDKIRRAGWGELTSIESGRVGGMINRYMHEYGWL